MLLSEENKQELQDKPETIRKKVEQIRKDDATKDLKVEVRRKSGSRFPD